MANRMYAPIWAELKEHGTATIKADPSYHPRIKKAVIKEKWLDTGYKLEMCDRNMAPTLEFLSDTKVPELLIIKLSFKGLGAL